MIASSLTSRSDGSEPPRTQAAFACLTFLASLALTGLYDLVAGGTYDYDEFVYLLLGHGVSSGRLPYRDFLFYHPPGILMVMGFLQPLIHQWWAWGRVLSLLLSAGTCALVYLTSRRFLPRTTSLIAALLFACDPILLVSGTRILPDVYVMFFTFLGIYLLLVASGQSDGGQRNQGDLDGRLKSSSAPNGTVPSNVSSWDLPSAARSLLQLREPDGTVAWRLWMLSVAAGVCFGIGVWFKYPAALAVPAALLLARRRSLAFLAAMAVTALILFAPFVSTLHHLYDDTVVYQQSRFTYPLGIRLGSILLFAVLLQPLAVFGAAIRPVRWWLLAGYAAAILYLGSSQVYYHYMLPIVPYAAILGAIFIASLSKENIARLLPPVAAGSIGVTLLWAAMMQFTPGNYPFHITSAQTASVAPVSAYIDRHVPPGSQIFDDQPDLPVLAYRANCDNYFWSDSTVATHSQIQFCLLHARYVIHFFAHGSGFPPGFLYRAYDASGIPPGSVDDKYRRTQAGSGQSGAFVYDTHRHMPYLPPRN